MQRENVIMNWKYEFDRWENRIKKECFHRVDDKMETKFIAHDVNFGFYVRNENFDGVLHRRQAEGENLSSI